MKWPDALMSKLKSEIKKMQKMAVRVTEEFHPWKSVPALSLELLSGASFPCLQSDICRHTLL